MLQHPRTVLAMVAVCVAALGIVGANVEQKLVPTTFAVEGTSSARAEAQMKSYFGESAPFAILLQGPERRLKRQGRSLVRTLKRKARATVLSPWDRGSVPELRPGRGRALVLVDFHTGIGDAITRSTTYLDAVLARRVVRPVQASVVSYASFLDSLKTVGDEAGRKAELISIPILLLILLLVFRSPLAALIPICFGIATVLSTKGVLVLLNERIEVDPVAVPIGSMMGLALGVDYALLLVSRFREELARGAAPSRAARDTRHTAGRTILMAGSTLLFSLGIAFFTVPGQAFRSTIGAVMVVAVLSVGMALLAGPATLSLLGASVDRWRIGQPAVRQARWLGWVNVALKRPGAVTLAIVVPMLAVAILTLDLRIGSAGIDQLPKNNRVRIEAETVTREAGPGWGAPFTIVVSTRRGAITRPRQFDAIIRWQRELARKPDVEAVIGPRRIGRRVQSVRGFGKRLLVSDDRHGPLAGLHRLGPNLGRAAKGVSTLRGGMVSASDGAGLLSEGAQRAQVGALALSGGLGRAAEGGGRAAAAVRRIANGSHRLASGQRVARLAAVQLELGLEDILPEVARNGLGRMRPLQADLARRAREQPELQRDADEAADLALRLARVKQEVLRMQGTAVKLHTALGRLAEGGAKLQRGSARLATATESLGGGLARLNRGSQRLATGLGQISGGAGVLSGRLAEGFHRSYPLQSGLRRASAETLAESRKLDRRLDGLRTNSPGFFDSGYFALSALDGASRDTRASVNQAVNVERGGRAARLLVIPTAPLGSPGSERLYAELRREAERVEEQQGVEVGVSGGTAELAEYTQITKARTPLLVAALAAATFLMLIVFLRSLLLPLIAVMLNLATVAFTLGVLSLVTRIPSGYPLGGNRVLNVAAMLALITIAFGLSIDYAVFLLTRMREAYARDGDNAHAVAEGLARTARVITGAAAIMAGVFLSFATTPLALIAHLGVGLAVAVILDATVLRVVLLPAIMLIVGERVWWLPRWLDRLIPKLEHSATPPVRGEPHPPVGERSSLGT
jgi:putative drug exporter of the RND superfamily